MSGKGKPAVAAASDAEKVKTPRQRWESTGVNRINNVIKALEILENCADKTNYEFKSEEISRMNSALDKSLGTVKTRFADALAGKVYKPVKEGFAL